MQPAIFLDRDGVIIENRSNYVRSWEHVEFIPAAVQALAHYVSISYLFVFVTNQSAVGRNIISFATAESINQKIVEKLAKNGCRIDGVFMCPHAPEDKCNCRKPRPGLLEQAAQMMSIDLSKSLMIGDAWTDLQAGQAAGVPKLGLVLTGRGRQQLNQMRPPDLTNLSVHNDLTEALEYLLNSR